MERSRWVSLDNSIPEPRGLVCQAQMMWCFFLDLLDFPDAYSHPIVSCPVCCNGSDFYRQMKLKLVFNETLGKFML